MPEAGNVSNRRDSTTVSFAPRFDANVGLVCVSGRAVVDMRISQSTCFCAAVAMPSMRNDSAVIVRGPENNIAS